VHSKSFRYTVTEWVEDGKLGKFTVRSGPPPREASLTDTVRPAGAAGMNRSTPLRNGDR
jgi:hypothetical protein